MTIWVILGVLGAVILLAIVGTLILPKLPSSPEEKREMDAKDELKKKMSDGEITSKTKWFFIQIGMGIPLVNLILLFVLAFKKEKTNLTIRNWAKANLIIVLVTTILTIALTLVIYFFFLEAFMTFIGSAK